MKSQNETKEQFIYISMSYFQNTMKHSICYHQIYLQLLHLSPLSNSKLSCACLGILQGSYPRALELLCMNTLGKILALSMFMAVVHLNSKGPEFNSISLCGFFSLDDTFFLYNRDLSFGTDLDVQYALKRKHDFQLTLVKKNNNHQVSNIE